MMPFTRTAIVSFAVCALGAGPARAQVTTTEVLGGLDKAGKRVSEIALAFARNPESVEGEAPEHDVLAQISRRLTIASADIARASQLIDDHLRDQSSVDWHQEVRPLLVKLSFVLDALERDVRDLKTPFVSRDADGYFKVVDAIDPRLVRRIPLDPPTPSERRQVRMLSRQMAEGVTPMRAAARALGEYLKRQPALMRIAP